MKVMFVVTHLLGSGHLSRILTMARAFNAAGHNAIVVSGGMPAPHLDTGDVTLIQLPPLQSDGVDFTRLLDTTGAAAEPDLMASRAAQLVAALTDEGPVALITELFPFGRRSLRNELVQLLETAKRMAQPPLICASIRDILAPPSKPAKAVFAQEMVTRFYDAVLVHSDPDITPLELSWPVDDMLRPALRYTGFVAPPPACPSASPDGAGEVIITAGGGDVGASLFSCAVAAAAQDPDRPWRLLVGGTQAQGRADTLRHNTPPNVSVELARSDFREMLHHAAASVSMCGYNTAQDVLQAGCPSVFVPFDAGQEVEQGIRARALSALDGIEVLNANEMTPATLNAALNEVLMAPRRPASTQANGAAQTVRIIEEMRALA